MTEPETNCTIADSEAIIIKALKKIGGMSEKELCRYLPGDTGGYMHHFTMKKLRKNKPSEFCSLIEEFILNAPAPRQIDPKPRERRSKALSLNQADLKKVLELAQKTEDTYLLSKLGSKLSLPGIKKELIRSIKMNRVDEQLWNFYIQALEAQQIAKADA